MAALTPQAVNLTGVTPTYTAISASDTVDISSLNNTAWLHIKNTGGGANTCTVVDAGNSPAGFSGVDPTYNVPITTGDKIIRLPGVLANTSGIITINNSAITGGTCAVFYLA